MEIFLFFVNYELHLFWEHATKINTSKKTIAEYGYSIIISEIPATIMA